MSCPLFSLPFLPILSYTCVSSPFSPSLELATMNQRSDRCDAITITARLYAYLITTPLQWWLLARHRRDSFVRPSVSRSSSRQHGTQGPFAYFRTEIRRGKQVSPVGESRRASTIVGKSIKPTDGDKDLNVPVLLFKPVDRREVFHLSETERAFLTCQRGQVSGQVVVGCPFVIARRDLSYVASRTACQKPIEFVRGAPRSRDYC